MGQICKTCEKKDIDKTELMVEQSPKHQEIKFIEDFDYISGLDKVESLKKMSLLSFQHKNNNSNYPYGDSIYQGSLFSVVTPDFSAFSSNLVQ
ncbi:unnamed protein product [Paramecium pentaurelia]|uniref:Uncharacterized protein n=1 Tax=Paramecium pentaurelia TaxID=43138 RepID=A0A8S1WVS4_9CILI|nr:unnamed protein product [Paramecium pentaurelia]